MRRRKRKKRFNSYKFERLFKRKVHRLRSSIDTTFFKATSRRQDFSWRGSRTNPHINRSAKVCWKHRLKVLTIVACSTITFGLVLYNGTFQINEINVEGLVRIDETDLRETVHATMGGKRLLVVPRTNYFFYNIKELQSILEEKYPIERSVVQKSFPSAISILVEEKITNLIYDNSKQYSYVDLSGHVVEIKQNVSDTDFVEVTEVVTSTNADGTEKREVKVLERNHKPHASNIQASLGEFPILYDKRHKEANINDTVLEEGVAASIVEWYNLIAKKTDIPLSYFEIDDARGEVIMYTKEGWHILARLERVEDQLTELQLVLNEKVTRPNLNYIDLRFFGRVYWK